MEKKKEIWKNIKGYKGYQISTHGRVKSFRRDKINGKLLKLSVHPTGYIYVTLYLGDKPKKHRVHRLVVLNFLEKVLNKNIVNHKDGNKDNNYVENLEWSTISENTQHAYDNNLIKNHLKGEEVFNSKLTEDIVRYIRKNYIKGSKEFGQRALGRKFGVTHATIQSVLNGKSWAHVM